MTTTPHPQPFQGSPADEGKLSYKIGRQELAAMSVYNCGSQRCTPGYQWGPGLRDHYLIHYIISGSGTYHTDGITRTVHAGGAFLVFPSTIISYVADEETPWHYCWVGFSGIDSPLLLKKTPFTPAGRFVSAGRTSGMGRNSPWRTSQFFAVWAALFGSRWGGVFGNAPVKLGIERIIARPRCCAAFRRIRARSPASRRQRLQMRR